MSKDIISNTGPLITLEKLEDGYNFIRKMYTHILIPQKVAEEVSEGFPSFDAYLQNYQINSLIKVQQISQIVDIPGIYQLDAGEIEAISLAYQLKKELLIEELKGRKIASSAGLFVSGIAGKIAHAFNQGVINQNH